MQETQVQSLSWRDPLKKEMASHSNILAWRIPWTEEPGRLQSMGSQRIGHNWANITDTEKMGNRVQETEKQGQSKVRREGRATVEKPGEKAKRMCRAVITT